MPYETDRPTPTERTYLTFGDAFKFLNERLFSSGLPPCLISLQRKKGSWGYFSGDRFRTTEGDTVDEIALNPAAFLRRPLRDVLSTLAHEMTHLEQHHHGKLSGPVITTSNGAIL